MPSARSSPFSRYRDILKEADRALGDIPPDAPFHVFHRSSDPERQKEAYSYNDRLSILPSEIFALILTYLSPPALDAARHVCLAWRARIMTSSYILATVIHDAGVKIEKGQSSEEEWLLKLNRKLDFQADLVRWHNGPDAWRTRYRQCNLDFYVAPFSTHSHLHNVIPPITITSTAFCINGTPLGYLVTEPIALHGAGPKTMNFYQFYSSGQPHYIGSVPFASDGGPPRILSLAKSKNGYAWTIELEIDSCIKWYAAEACSAFSKGDSPFTLRQLEHSVRNVEKKTFGSLTALSSSNVLAYGREWEHLGSIPNAHRPLRAAKSLSLAKHVISGDLCIIRVQDIHCDTTKAVTNEVSHNSQIRPFQHMDVEQTILSVAQLLPPRAKLIMRNLAVATSPSSDDTVLIAIIWQDAVSSITRTELYVYEIPDFSHALHSTDDQRHLDRCTYVRGKRIRSLDPTIGGIHSTGSLWQLQDRISEEPTLQYQATLGGLHILQTSEIARSPRLPHQAIYVWGPKANHVSLAIFDLSYAGPYLHSLTERFQSSSASSHSATFIFKKVDPNLLNSWYVPCQCSLHDDGYRIVLPDTRCAALVPVKYRSIWGWRKETRSKPASGSVSHYNTPARAAALKRKDEWLRERIRCMKRAGLTNEEIGIAWNEQRWTEKGLVDMPDKWKEIKL